MKKTLRGPNGLKINLDKTQVFNDDPGAGTPAMVYLERNGRVVASATYWCACGEGELEGYSRGDGAINLSDAQMNWLNEQELEVDKFLYSK